MEHHIPSAEETNVWLSGFGLAVAMAIGSIIFLIAMFRRRSRPIEIASHEIAREEQDRSAPRCICGERATDPSPTLMRSRSDILRSYFGAPPRYKRTVDRMGEVVYCRSHAHQADVELDKFIYDIRSEQAAVNAGIAAKAANFEQEGLAKRIAETLTDEQKRASRRPSNVTRIGQTG